VGVWQQEIEHELIRDMSWPQSMGIPALFAAALCRCPWTGQTPEVQHSAEPAKNGAANGV